MRTQYRGFDIYNGVISEKGHRIYQTETEEDAKEWIDWALGMKDQQAVLIKLEV